MKFTNKQVLVKVHDVYSKTEWNDRKKLRRARQAGLIEMIRRDGKIFYNLASVAEQFLKVA